MQQCGLEPRSAGMDWIQIRQDCDARDHALGHCPVIAGAPRYGQEMSTSFKLLPTALEKYFLKEFNIMLWTLMQQAAEMTHLTFVEMT